MFTEEYEEVLRQELLLYFQDLVKRLDDDTQLAEQQFGHTIDKIFIAQGWANPKIPNARAFRESVAVVVEGVLQSSGLMSKVGPGELKSIVQRFSNEANAWTARDVFVYPADTGFYGVVPVAGKPEFLGRFAESEAYEETRDSDGLCRVTLEREFLESDAKAYRLTSVLEDDDKGAIAYAEMQIIEGRFTGRHANVTFLSTMDELDDESTGVAYQLNELYGAEKIFKEGALLILNDTGVRNDLRGNGLGLRYLQACLRIAKKNVPALGAIATHISPGQYRPMPAERMPRAVLTDMQADKLRLERYWAKAQGKLLAAIGAEDRPDAVFVYGDNIPTSFFEACMMVGETVLRR